MENERRGKRRGEKDAKRKEKERRNGKIKEEERRRRSADDDNGSGQGAVEREKKREEDSVVRVWERDKGWKGGGERRGYLTVPPREAVEVLIRNAGDHLHETRSSTPSSPSPLPPSFAFLPPLIPFHQLAVLSLRVSLFPRFVSLLSSQFSPTCSLFYFASFFFRAYRFSRYPDLLYFALMSINLSPFLTFIDSNLLLCFYNIFIFLSF